MEFPHTHDDSVECPLIAISQTFTPRRLSGAAALLPVLAFPFLPPDYSHNTILWTCCFNVASYLVNLQLWIDGKARLLVPFYAPILTNFMFILSCLGMIRGPNFRRLRATHSDVNTCACIASILALIQCIGYDLSSTADRYAAGNVGSQACMFRVIFYGIAVYVATPTILDVCTKCVSVVLSEVAARRTRWLFRFHEDDIKANALADRRGHDHADAGGRRRVGCEPDAEKGLLDDSKDKAGHGIDSIDSDVERGAEPDARKAKGRKVKAPLAKALVVNVFPMILVCVSVAMLLMVHYTFLVLDSSLTLL
ncbi:hypothetical protein Trco_005345 [Trichoderma cornu-damae]|uniref:Uncharacterized protein n=1 Tax=Trichoderma cornu-damae TaxID=654480 RepID=A0A9P8QPL8_9HYPO|nr:hypothetical protein Trco_005345 [Trichoderma cornu-damae]